jgi:hypothetical protein
MERAFRTLKSHLDPRPMFHWTDARIQGHVTVCVLALVLEYTLQRLLHDVGCLASTRTVLADLERVQSVPLTVGDHQYLCRTPLVGQSAAAFRVAGVPFRRASPHCSAATPSPPHLVAIFSTFMPNSSQELPVNYGLPLLGQPPVATIERARRGRNPSPLASSDHQWDYDLGRSSYLMWSQRIIPEFTVSIEYTNIYMYDCSGTINAYICTLARFSYKTVEQNICSLQHSSVSCRRVIRTDVTASTDTKILF